MLMHEFSEHDGFYRKDGKFLANDLVCQFIYQYIKGFEENKHQAYFSVAHLCKFTKKCDKTVRTHLNKMRDFGLISCEEREGDTKIYNTLPITESMLSGNFDGEEKPSSKSKQAVINEPVSEPVEVAPEPAQHSISRNFPSYDDLFGDNGDQEPCWDAQPKQAIPHATPLVKNKYSPGDIDLFASDNKPTVTPQEPKQTTVVKDEEVKYLGLMRTFMCYWNDGKFEGISDFKKGMEIFKPLVEKSLKKPIAIPEDFYERLTNFNDDVADKWGIPF